MVEVSGFNTIDIKIKKIGQLFNSLDPSPFLDKDLDDDFFEYVVSSVAEHHLTTKHKIIIHLPKSEQKKISEIEITRSIHNFFEYRKLIATRSIRLKIKEGQMSLWIGLGFLASCLIARNIVLSLNDSVAIHILAEGLTIGGWVAMWKPISDLLYEWWPTHQERKIFDKIVQTPIEFRYE